MNVFANSKSLIRSLKIISIFKVISSPVRLHEKWMHLTPEQKETMKAEWKGKCECSKDND